MSDQLVLLRLARKNTSPDLDTWHFWVSLMCQSTQVAGTTVPMACGGCDAKDLFSYASEYVRQFNELDQCDRHDLWDGMDVSEI